MKKIKITEAQAKLLGLIKTPKNTLRITQEQYNRIFGSKIVSESFPKVNALKVDKQIKRQFHEDETIEPIPMKLSDFKKPLHGVSNSKTFNKPVMEEVEVHDQSSIEFVKFLYGKGELSEEWNEDMIREAIAKLSKSNLIVPTEDGNFKVSNSMGDPKSAMAAIKQELDSIKSQGDEMGQEIPMGSEQGIEEVDTDSSGSPDYIPADEYSGTKSKQPTVYKVLYVTWSMALLEKDGNLYFFNYRDSNYEDDVEDYIGSWKTDIDGGKNELTVDDMQHFINDYTNDLNVGVGEQGLMDGNDLILLDDYGIQWVLKTYSNDKNVKEFLGKTNESDGNFVSNVKKAYTEPSKGAGTKSREELRRDELIRRAAEKKALKDRYDSAEEIDEMSSTGSVGGSFLTKLELSEGPVAGPASTGPYDANALGGIGRNGEFKKVGKTKAETTPQWAGGSFVEQPECSKLNNNKEAQNGGCNTGASSLKLKKASGSVNAPSLAENKIYEAIAAKTGLSIQKIKTIIESKKGKA